MGSTRVTWEGRPVEAWLPTRIAKLVVDLPVAVARRTERAAAAVVRVGDRSTGAMEVAARLFLRREGLASSAIEGLRASAAEVAIAEAAAVDAATDTAAWVADNLAAVTDALADPGPLNQKRLFAWHRRLMRHAPIDPAHVGAWRDRLGWVGGANPLVATYVPPPHNKVPALMEDLFTFVARDDLDPVTQAAVAHAQFEIIHPFADGNGRIGRVLIGRLLARRLDVPVPPPVSVQFARDIGGYLSGLTLYRQGDVQPWVSWFADAVEAAATRSGEVLDMVAEVQQRWHASLQDMRADAAARRLVDVLPAHPVLSVRTAAALANVSEQAARTALHDLAGRNVLRPVADVPTGRGRPQQWWVVDDLLAILAPV
jgi:Fic family protein